MTTSINPQLELEPIERQICQLVDDACRWIHETRPMLSPDLEPEPDANGNKPPSAAETLEANGWHVEARIAGGWVRDKLLHLASDDMDVTLSSLTGFHFAHYLKLYLESPQFQRSSLCAELASLPDRKGNGAMGNISKIEANPEQSKNLETATVGVLGRSLDFVNLRKETYLKGSRIPIQEFGTPVEDAERRDCTVNSLFYNVHTRVVEDMTGKGLPDLAAGVIRTPLEPFQTFDDDPLRILRCIRFASRFAFSVHDDIKGVLLGPRGHELRHELGSKISRERFGIETDKMLRGPHPALALELVRDFDLFNTVFRPPPESDGSTSALYLPSDTKTPVEPLRPNSSGVELARTLDNIWHKVQPSKRPDTAFTQQAPLFDPEQRRRLFYAAALWPLAGLITLSHPPEPKPGAKAPKRTLISATDSVLLEGLKVGVKITKEPVDALFKSLQALAEFRTYEQSAIEAGTSREEIQTELFFLLRKPHFVNEAYDLSPVSAFLFAALAHTYAGPHDTLAAPTDLDRWWHWIEESHMVQRAAERPLLNGLQIQEVVGFPPGPLIPKIQHQLLRWQLWNVSSDAAARPTPAAVEAAQAWFQQAWESGSVIPAEELERARAAAANKGAKSKKKPGKA